MRSIFPKIIMIINSMTMIDITTTLLLLTIITTPVFLVAVTIVMVVFTADQDLILV